LDRTVPTLDQIGVVIEKARDIAVDYYRLTGKSLGITGEVGEYEVAHLLGLKLAGAREAGFDATDSGGRRLQIKTRSFPATRARAGQRVRAIDLTKPWDVVILVVMDEDFRCTEIYEAERDAITDALQAPGSRARNERGALAISKFKSVGNQVWPI
jgi:hypothetical protein